MLEAGPDACHPARELADAAGPAEQQPTEEQQQQSHRLADERGFLAGAHLAGDVLFLGTAESRVPVLQRYVSSAPPFPFLSSPPPLSSPPSSLSPPPRGFVLCAARLSFDRGTCIYTYYSRTRDPS